MHAPEPVHHRNPADRHRFKWRARSEYRRFAAPTGLAVHRYALRLKSGYLPGGRILGFEPDYNSALRVCQSVARW